MIINAIRAKDTPLVMASVLFFTVIIGLINLLVDILYAFIDPRVASRYRG
jgi:peptide/nickel transport system permease protein